MSTAQVVRESVSAEGSSPRPSPDKFFETMVAYQRTAATKVSD